MAAQTSGSQTGQSDPDPVVGESPGGRPMGASGITLITVYLVLVTVVVFHSLVVLWPPVRQEPDEDVQAIAERLEKRLEEALAERPGVSGEAATAEGETPGEGGTTEPMGSDLGEPLGTELAGPMGTDLEGGSGSAVPAEEEAPEGEGGEGTKCPDGEQVRAKLFWFLKLCLSDEERLFLIVMFAGALGGLVHSLRSFSWYAGERKLVLSWTGFYITLPILGATLATVFYLVIRGGFFSPQSEIADTSPFGFAALAALIGMFTEQAAEKLKQITETIFAAAPKGANHAGPAPAAPTISGIAENNRGPQGGGTTVTIAGSGFAQGATVTLGGQAATNVQVASDGTSIKADTPGASAAGPVTVEVTNPDRQKASLANGFTYV